MMSVHHNLKAIKTSKERCDFTPKTLEEWLETTTDMGDEDDDIDSCSTFSLQQCIDEFRARRIRRNSTHICEQREDQLQQHQQETVSAEKVGLGDADLINQNRSNKEHERKYKPCKNGFCYCFTSDSGDGGRCFGATSINTARGASQIRHARRSRKSESTQQPGSGTQQPSLSNKAKERRSAPACLKSNVPTLVVDASELKQQKKSKTVQVSTNTRRPLIAVSRLETTTHDAPLIHIIQELRDNCVVSEVRVNKHKLEKKRLASKPGIDLTEKPQTTTRKTLKEPTAPPMEKTTSTNKIVESKLSKVDSSPGNSIPTSRLEVKNKSPKRKPGAGRLLQKRLSHTNVQYKPWDITEPPPKPPRASTGSRLESSSSSLTTSSSIREAERIVDDFLIKNGIEIPKSKEHSEKGDEGLGRNHKKQMSSSVAPKDQHGHLPTCPSLSDIERTVDTKPRSNYGKNIQPKKQQVKDIALGWKESKVSEMLSYDSNGNRKEFKSQSAQAEPQSLGWQIPPKLNLDTVDGAMRHNLAANLETKDTPVKRQFDSNRKEQHIPRLHPKFGWRNLSPWKTVATHGTRMRKCPKGTSSFLRQSKKKILRLVTPKKDNKEHNFLARKNLPFRSVGIQTSLQDLASYANSSTPQSPPGSYHSAVQAISTSHQSSTASNNAPHSQSTNPSDSFQFDFTRKINSPKKPTRTSQRKLNFPTVCGATSACFAQNSGPEMETSKSNGFPNSQPQTLATRTYRSYQTGINQDVTISKMGVILSNIRARLEASDEHAVRTFEEIERREQLQRGFDCPDSLGIRQRTCVDIHSRITYPERGYVVHEPIYSEIEEDSIHVTESPQFDNKTGIESSCSMASGAVDLETLYAKVNKPSKQKTSSVPLGKFLHDSLQRKQKSLPLNHLPTLPEPSISNVSYSSPPLDSSIQHSDYDSPTSSLMHCQSLNNIRVMEHNSPPNHNRNLSKSDLSLQRSEIFLENLCRSELIVEGGTLERLEKMDNLLSKHNSDYISYDAPDEFNNISSDKMKDTASHSTSTSPQKFLTKPFPRSSGTNVDEALFSNQHKGSCSSCSVTPRKFTISSQQIIQSNSQPNSLNNTIATETGTISSAFARCKRLKQALQNSIRKGKNFVKSRRDSSTLNFTQPIEEQLTTQSPEVSIQEDECCLNLDSLFVIDETVPVIEQIARAVSVCRQLPELERTHEMVEAERLLLFTTLRYDTKKQFKHQRWNKNTAEEGLKRNLSINAMRFPINFEPNLDDYFNYYFTATFEIDGQIISTQSTECRQGEVVFQRCNIEFNTQKYQNEDEPSIQCNVFMLRLRKVTTEPNDARDTLNLTSIESPDVLPLCSTPVSSMSSLNGITSRFRQYGSFTIDAQTFKPFVSCDNDVAGSDMLILRASRIGSATMKLYTKHESVNTTISIDANVTAYFPKKTQSGFLHVQDPYSQHNWNRRWCILNGLHLEVWTDMSCMNETPLLRLSLFSCKQPLPLMACAQGLCARTRSFCLQCLTTKDGVDADTASVFFAAENEVDLCQWLQYLNEALNFIATWTQ